MKQIILAIVMSLFIAIPLSFAADENSDEGDIVQLVNEIDQYTPYQDQDRDSINMVIYQYYNDPDSRGNVPGIVGDTREYTTSSTVNQSAANLNPAVDLSPF